MLPQELMSLVQQNAQEPTKRLKRGRPVGSKDTIPRKRKTGVKINTNQNTPEKAQESFDKSLSNKLILDEEQLPLEKEEKDENNEISINYLNSGKIWDRNEIVPDDIFAFNVSFEICENDDDPRPRSVDECQKRPDWQKWQDAIQAELNSLRKREVFGPIVQTPDGVKPVGYKWVFVRKRNEKNEVTRYKARLVAQGFSQRPGIDYEETYSPVIDAITFRFLISLASLEGLDMHLMDVVKDIRTDL
ncbi:hypothetical protein Sjap_001548 [Stephania japonica]|uniref:Reverse transcriptase Ty1/copia-type domain-containing protein n=1 Tax=Stephania japonica TaxID=461633 RepID=A0AAP0KLN8_9MAGN